MKKLVVVLLVLLLAVGLTVVVGCGGENETVETFDAPVRDSQTRTCKANLRTIDGAINTYYSDAEVFPDDISDMTSGPYQVLKIAPQCPTNDSYYELEPGTPPTVACPDSIEGHVI